MIGRFLERNKAQAKNEKLFRNTPSVCRYKNTREYTKHDKMKYTILTTLAIYYKVNPYIIYTRWRVSDFC